MGPPGGILEKWGSQSPPPPPVRGSVELVIEVLKNGMQRWRLVVSHSHEDSAWAVSLDRKAQAANTVDNEL
jgi:hypothetical protein